jgi:hypothetical protein
MIPFVTRTKEKIMSDQLTLESLQSRLEEFRKTRSSKKARIPEDIWLDACVLCETQKPSVVAKVLGLRFDEAKKRVEALSGEACVEKKKTSRRAGGFVELGSIGGGWLGQSALSWKPLAALRFCCRVQSLSWGLLASSSIACRGQLYD